jgi:hypothetical protein
VELVQLRQARRASSWLTGVGIRRMHATVMPGPARLASD